MKKRNFIRPGVLGMMIMIGIAACKNTKTPQKSVTNPISETAKLTEAMVESETLDETESESETIKEIQTVSGQEETSRVTEVAVETENIQNRELNVEELEDFSEFLSRVDNYGFLLSSYTKPEDVDLNQVLYGGAGITEPPLTEEERSAYLEIDEIYTDITHLTTVQIDEFLQRKMGINLTDVTQKLTWTYLPQFDTYYHQHGDTNRVMFTCVSGHIEGDMVYLESEPYDSHVSLRKNGDDYQFVASQISIPY